MNSAIPRFYRLTMAERRERVGRAAGLTEDELSRLSPTGGLADHHAERMVENALGVFGLPQGVCVNVRLNGRDVLVPMVVEEPSVIAACSYASKLLRAGGGVIASCSTPIVVGQIQLMEVADPGAAAGAIVTASDELIALANSGHPHLCSAGGGARSLLIRWLPNRDDDDPCGPMLVIHLSVDVRDAMGANVVNSMCERIAPRIAELTGGRVGLRILSNLADQRTVTVTGRVPFVALEGKGAASGEELAQRIMEASVFAERDPYRACTHNKGIMNGIDAAAIALGQDWRAVEAGAHAYAARGGRYTAMARWRTEDGYLVGRMTLPLAVGVIGGVARTHPIVAVNRKIARIEHADELAQICATAGLAQNLGALRALAAEGIQHGHMRLHARNVAVEAGAEDHEVHELAQRIADAGKVNAGEAGEALEKMRSQPPPPPTAMPPARRERPPTPLTPRHVRGPIVESTIGSSRNIERELGGPILVTDSTGHLGANLVRRLLDDGHGVRVLLREGENPAGVDGLDVERFYGDVRDAVEGVRFVFCGAVVEPALDIEREIADRNGAATKRLLCAAREAGVERVVVTSSGTTNDAHPGSLDVVFATSCAILGPNDYQPSRMGRALIDFANGQMPAYVSGGLPFVSARDLVEGHLLAATRGRSGHAYVFATAYLEIDDLLAIFEEVSGRPRPRVRLPGALVAPIAEATIRALGSVFPKTRKSTAHQRLAPHAMRALLERRHADTSQAKRDLGFRPTDIRRAVHDAYRDFARRGLVPARPGTTEPPVVEKRGDQRLSSPSDGRLRANRG